MGEREQCTCDNRLLFVWERGWEVVEPMRDGTQHRVYRALVRCRRCGASWRTDAAYVEHLPPALPGDGAGRVG